MLFLLLIYVLISKIKKRLTLAYIEIFSRMNLTFMRDVKSLTSNLYLPTEDRAAHSGLNLTQHSPTLPEKRGALVKAFPCVFHDRKVNRLDMSCCSVSVSGREIQNEGIRKGCLLTSEEISNSAEQTVDTVGFDISERGATFKSKKPSVGETEALCKMFSGVCVCGEIIQHMLILVLINNCNYRPCQIWDQQGMVESEDRLDEQNHTSPITGSCQVLTTSSADKKKSTHGRFQKDNVKQYFNPFQKFSVPPTGTD